MPFSHISNASLKKIDNNITSFYINSQIIAIIFSPYVVKKKRMSLKFNELISHFFLINFNTLLR